MRIKLLISILLLAFVVEGQGIRNFGFKKHTGPSALSAPTYTGTGHDYQTGRAMYEYLPRGYTQAAAGSLPLMIVMPGDGVRSSWASVNSLGEGIGYYLNTGAWDDLTYGHIVVIPQLTVGDVDYSDVDFDDILTKLTAEGVKYDPNRISVSGLSRGAMGCDAMLINRYSQIASVIQVSGPGTTSGWANYNGIGFWQHIGTNDGSFGESIGGTLYNANGAAGAWRDLTPAPRASYYYNLGHSSSVWDNHVYKPSTAEYNLFQYAAKFNKVALNQADQFTANAETTLDIVDYREAKMLTDLLSSGAPKTALLARLATLLTTINQSGNRYYVSLRNTGSLSTGYNVITAFTTGSIISNIVDFTNAASGIDFEITQEFATSSRAGNTSSYNANKMKSHGFDDYLINTQCMNIASAVNNGVITLKQIPTGKLVDIFIYTHHVAGNDDQDVSMTTDNQVEVVCNSVTKTQYAAYNNYRAITYTNVPESSGNITIAIDATSSRNVGVTAIEFLVHN